MNDLQETLDTIDVQEWLENNNVDYKRINDNGHLSECPFCGGRKAYINLKHGRGLCFSGSCSETFNLFTFARQLLGLDNRGTVQHFKDYARAGIIHTTPKAVVEVPVKTLEGTLQLPNSIALPTPDGKTHPFLARRGIDLTTQKLFGLRYCDEGHFEYEDHFGNKRYQDFSKRIIIPVYDLDGSLVSFQGRATWDVNEDAGEQRYLFPIGVPGTGRFLYGGNLICNSVCNDKCLDSLVISEGPFDTIAISRSVSVDSDLQSYNVVASFGLSISHSSEDGNDQLGRLRTLKRRGLKNIIICWDGERNAYLQALEAAKILSSEGFVVKVATLPQDRDPNEIDHATLKKTLLEAQTFNSTTYILGKLNPPYKPKE